MAWISSAPAATDAPETKADWLEFEALRAEDKNSSLQDLVQAIRRSGSIDALEDDDDAQDRGSELSQLSAEDAFEEIDERMHACGGPDGCYPFRVEQRYIELKDSEAGSLYLFLLLLSLFGKDAGPEDGAKLFEEVSAAAAQAYLGGNCRVADYYLFGAPRRSSPSQFRAALDDLCSKLGEGQGCRNDRSSLKDQKDAKLDLVVWQPFPDRRVGKLIAFGQCATGQDWRDKLSELQPSEFCAMWLRDMPAHGPVRLFFMPFRVDQAKWMEVSRRGGILFDRCRISFHASPLREDLAPRVSRWCQHVLGQIS